MCIGISFALVLLLLYFTDATLAELSLHEQIGEQSVMISQGWGMVENLWSLGLLFMAIGVMMTLGFLKFKKVI